MAQPNQNNGVAPMIKPSQVDGLPHFTPDQKSHYKNGLATLWQQLETNPQGSQAYHEAENKIRAASLKIMQQLGRGPGQRPTSGGGPPQQPNQNTPNAGQGNMAQNTQQGNRPQGGQGQGAEQYSEFVRQQMKQITTVNIPDQIQANGEAAIKTYRSQVMRQGLSILQKKENIMKKGQQLQSQTRQIEGTGQQVPQELAQQLSQCKRSVQEVNQDWENFKARCAGGQEGAQGMQRQGSSQGNQQNGGQQQGQPMQRTNSSQNANAGQQGDVKMNMNQQPAHSPTQNQGGFQQPPQQQPQQQPSHIAPSPAQQNVPQQPPSAHPQQTPQSATQPQQSQFPQQHNMQQQQQPPQNQQQQRPMNPQMVQQNMGQQQPPQQPMQPNQQQQHQRPQPHTHQSALQQASFHRQQSQNQQQQQDQNQQPQVPNGLPFNPPASATQQTPNSAYPLQTNSGSSGTSTKFPIPKQLQMDPRMQQPVPGPQSRPTFGNAGMMSQPGVQRPAQFTLEGDSDRVLSKRKLDELVRQVTGSPADGTAESGLAPDVEEAVLTLADDFVDNVITSACRLAKLRPNQTLDIKDIQIVLERNYGIRIPGYALDEVRTVRKFQPAPGWQSKMQAIQAGKVMGKDKE